MSGLGRRLCVALEGVRPTSAERGWLQEHRPAGVILFTRNVGDLHQLAGLCRELHDLVPGIEISADHEGGPVSHLAAALGRPPAPWTLGALGDPETTRQIHLETALRLRSAGVDRVLAPVADVLAERSNPVIGSRAFGSDPQLVCRHVEAAVKGLLAGGVMVCLKHWPGHGASLTDTHLQGARRGSATDTGFTAPFAAGLAAGADAVMVGHLPAPGSDLPATLDAAFLTRTRNILAGPGDHLLLFADDVSMGALRGPMARLGAPATDGREEGLVDVDTLGKTWLATIAAAGCDRILLRGIPWRALPLAGSAGGPDDQVGDPATSVRISLPEASGYDRVRRSAARQAVPEFASQDRDLLWIDAHTHDRWWGIGQDPDTGRRELAAVLETGFRSLRRYSVDEALDGRYDRLLVTSFRPWRPAEGVARHLPGCLAPRGTALVMGHPQLREAVRALLPDGWTICALFDVFPGDIEAMSAQQ